MRKGFKLYNVEQNNISTAHSLRGMMLQATPANKTSKNSFSSVGKPEISIVNNQQDLQIYFNQQKRKIHFHRIIDNYFNSQPSTAEFQKSPQSIEVQPLPRKQIQSSKSSRKKYQQIKYFKKISSQNKSIPVNLKQAIQNSSLTIIEELAIERRPFSQSKRTRINLSQRNISQSMSFQNKSGHDISDRLILSQNKLSAQNKGLSPFKRIEFDNLSVKYPQHKKSSMNADKSKTVSYQNHEKLNRQIRVKRLGMEVIWKMGQNQRALQFPFARSLKELCYWTIQQGKGQQSLHIINPTKYYYSLFVNDNQQLKDIIISIAKTICRQNRLISNCQINLDKIIKIQEKKFLPMDWGCSASKEEIIIQDRTLSNITPPLLKLGDQWLIKPQFLAPQMLRAHIKSCYSELWMQKGGISACDIWSLGCLIYEILGLVPLSAINFCQIAGKSSKRRGFLGCRIRSAQNILIKQKNLNGSGIRMLKQQLKSDKFVVSNRIMNLLPMMLQQNVQKRITPQQIIKMLS